jgi:hypothetical protein
MKKGFFKKVTKRQMLALKDIFLLGTALKKRWVKHPPAIQKRIKKQQNLNLK